MPIGISVFVAYWGVPLVFCLVDGTILSDVDLASSNIVKLPGLDLMHSPLAMSSGQSYFMDRSHFLFSLALAAGSSTGVLVLHGINRTVDDLLSDGPLNARYETAVTMYQYYKYIANHWISRIIAFILTGSAGYLFYEIWVGSENWWG
jgi:hypothetical protein